MHIDDIRKLSLQYAKGTPPKTRTKPVSRIRKKHKYRIDVRSLALYLAEPLHAEAREHHLKRLHLSTYQDYVQSSHWKSFRLTYINSLISPECELTFCKNIGVILHHRSYANMGNEQFEDVALVCESCHYKIHTEIARIVRNKKLNKKILGGLLKRPIYSPQESDYAVEDAYSLPWGGLFERRLVAESTKSAEL